MKVPPPKKALKFLRWFCREDYIEEIEGDLTEVFEKQYAQSPGKAKRKFAWSVIKYFRPEFIKSFRSGYIINHAGMFRHNILITWRNFLRYKSSFFINLAGLSAGLACALLIYLWVNDEVHIDKFHEKDEQLYQVFQFALSIILIVCVLVIYKQIEFIQSKHLGYDRDNIIFFEMEKQQEVRLQTFLSEVKKIQGVVKASSFDHNLLGDHGGTTAMEWEGKDPALKVEYASLAVGYDFIETVGIEMAAGRTFSREISPERQIIFNEDAIEKMGIRDPIGKNIKLWGLERQIVGVTKNFNFESLHEEIKPAFFQLYPESENIMVKIQAGTAQTTIQALEKLYLQFSPGLTFDYKFLDTDYQTLYAAEQRIGILSRYFATIAILISCLGLFGLAAFTAERRIKEIGIRKILGATDAGIISLLSADFIKMVIAAIAIGLPVSYVIGYQWLESFAYRIELEWWFFVGAGLLALFIAWFTVGVQTFKAARINPTECLRNE